MARPTPYIGITGITQRSQAQHILHACDFKKHACMVGVLASSKTLRGETTKWPERYPNIGAIASIFPESFRSLGLVHFHSDGGRPLADELEEVALHARTSVHFHGFQLNITWPNPGDIEAFREKHHHNNTCVIVLQCGARAMHDAGHDPKEIARRVAQYDHLVDYVLIDPSGGLGKPFDPHFAADCFEQIFRSTKNVGLGVAGGLCAETMHLLEPLLKRRYKFSIDAEGKMRDSRDILDLDAAVRYVHAAEKLFMQYA